ncbi:MAG: methyltransferase domain-containing protein [Patescibacteria group bacterium]
MININYSKLEKEARDYWEWSALNPFFPVSESVAKEGAGSELRNPLMHYGAVMPVYLAAARYLQALRLSKNAKLVELGCGTGRALVYLKTIFPHIEILGADYSKEIIDYAKSAYGRFGVQFMYIESAKNTQFPASSFDVVLSSHVIEHIEKREGLRFLEEARRILKPKGYAFIGTPERRNCQNLYMENPNDEIKYRLILPHKHEYTLPELRAAAEQVFSIGEVRIDALYNHLLRGIFSLSAQRFKPDGSFVKNIASAMYQGARNMLPRTVFDALVRFGISAQMRFLDASFFDVLSANRIGKEDERKTPDNLFLVCQK